MKKVFTSFMAVIVTVVTVLCGIGGLEARADYVSDWSPTYPSGISGAKIESRTEYRYSDKSTTTSTSSSLSGWTRTGSTTSYGSWGSWSAWQTSAISSSDTKDVQSATVYGYYYFRCPNCGAHMHVYTSCYTWAGGCGKSVMSSGNFTYMWSNTSWSNAGFYEFHGTGHYATDKLSGGRWFKWVDNGTARTGYRYRTRSKTITYSYEKWSSWSSWSPSYVASSSTRKVETRTVYRYIISSINMADCNISLEYSSCSYDGSGKTPYVNVYTSSGILLTKGSDYSVSYSDNVEPGTASVIITGIGNNYGTVYKSFTINKVVKTISVNKAISKTYSTSTQTFSLGATVSSGETIKYSSSSSSVKVSSKGVVTIPAKFMGIVTIKLTSPESAKFKSASATVTLTVKPKKTTLLSVTPGTKKLTAKWSRNTSATGYQIYYSTSSDFSSGTKAATITSQSTVAVTIKNLITGKVYYVKIRAYKMVGTKKIYGAWSSVLKCKVK